MGTEEASLTPTEALVSCSRSIDTSFRRDYLKLAFLWHDAILLEEIGNYTVDCFIERITEDEPLDRNHRASLSDSIVPLSARVGKEDLEAFSKSLPSWYPRWGEDQEHYDYPEPEDAFQFAHNQLFRLVEREFGVERLDWIDVEQAEGRCRVATDSVQLWTFVYAVSPCLLLANSDEEAAMRAAMSFGVTPSHAPSAMKLLQASIPEMTDVAWSKVIALKSRGAFRKLREKIDSLVAQAEGEHASATALLRKAESDALEEIVEAHRPRFIRTSIRNVITNLPVPYVNPVGIYVSAKEVYDEAQKAKKLSWFYALRDLRKLAE